MSNGEQDVRPGGWLTFSAVILILAGIMRCFDAIWSFGYRGQLPENLKDAVLGDTLATYGWWWLITGVILIGAGFAVLAGRDAGRWAGIAAAIIAALGAITWMPYFPVWSLVYVAIGIAVIYGLTVRVET